MFLCMEFELKFQLDNTHSLIKLTKGACKTAHPIM